MFLPVYDHNSLKNIPFQYVTIMLIAANVALFMLKSSGMDIRAVASFAVVPKELIEVRYIGGSAHGPHDLFAIPERYTLLAYMFFHYDIWHLVGNMLFLWVFGDNVEDAMGHFRFLLFYLLCGIAAGLTHTVILPESQSPLIGASGAVAGVIAAYLMLHPRVHVWVLGAGCWGVLGGARLGAGDAVYSSQDNRCGRIGPVDRDAGGDGAGSADRAGCMVGAHRRTGCRRVARDRHAPSRRTAVRSRSSAGLRKRPDVPAAGRIKFDSGIACQ